MKADKVWMEGLRSPFREKSLIISIWSPFHEMLRLLLKFKPTEYLAKYSAGYCQTYWHHMHIYQTSNNVTILSLAA
jgi:hypothetical protein